MKEILLFSTNAYLELDDLKQMTHLVDIRFSSSFKNSRNNFTAKSWPLRTKPKTITYILAWAMQEQGYFKKRKEAENVNYVIQLDLN